VDTLKLVGRSEDGINRKTILETISKKNYTELAQEKYARNLRYGQVYRK
jgi:hypothetical protein